MITVLIYAPRKELYFDEFHRRFNGKFQYRCTTDYIEWEHMRIMIVDREPRGYLADIAIGFNQQGVDMFTRKSHINIKKKRTTTYFDLLRAIKDDGGFDWATYLKKDEDDWWPFE